MKGSWTTAAKGWSGRRRNGGRGGTTKLRAGLWPYENVWLGCSVEDQAELLMSCIPLFLESAGGGAVDSGLSRCWVMLILLGRLVHLRGTLPGFSELVLFTWLGNN